MSQKYIQGILIILFHLTLVTFSLLGCVCILRQRDCFPCLQRLGELKILRVVNHTQETLLALLWRYGYMYALYFWDHNCFLYVQVLRLWGILNVQLVLKEKFHHLSNHTETVCMAWYTTLQFFFFFFGRNRYIHSQCKTPFPSQNKAIMLPSLVIFGNHGNVSCLI